MLVRQNLRNASKKRILPWTSILLSFTVGIFIIFLLYIKSNVNFDTSSKIEETKIYKVIQPTFDFYTLLPDRDILDTVEAIDETVVTSSSRRERARSKITEKETYILQVGSFKQLSDGEILRAKLAFLGIESKINIINIDNYGIWHRIQVGPVIGKDTAYSMQQQLLNNNIDSLLIRTKHG